MVELEESRLPYVECLPPVAFEYSNFCCTLIRSNEDAPLISARTNDTKYQYMQELDMKRRGSFVIINLNTLLWKHFPHVSKCRWGVNSFSLITCVKIQCDLTFHLLASDWTLVFFFSHQCQTEEQQRGVCKPRDPVAAAVPEKRYQQVSTQKSTRVVVLVWKLVSVSFSLRSSRKSLPFFTHLKELA